HLSTSLHPPVDRALCPEPRKCNQAWLSTTTPLVVDNHCQAETGKALVVDNHLFGCRQPTVRLRNQPLGKLWLSTTTPLEGVTTVSTRTKYYSQQLSGTNSGVTRLLYTWSR
ncbi:hypothetical protein Taro_023198, partial [Colocasia esculenta]|nr:hypothetical protein [Colocasia esculenta]